MARVVAADVTAIIDTTVDPAPYITAANLLVTRHCVDDDLTTDELFEIERWLAAHLLATQDQIEASTGMGASRVTFQGQTGLGLDGTRYGQQVKLLDSTGKLALRDKAQLRATITAL